MTPETVLDCGHERTPEGCAYGTAHTADGRVICLRCAETEEVAAFLADDPGGVGAYLSGDERTITTWTGVKLADVIPGTLSHTAAGFGGWRSGSGRVYFRARDARGRTWYGNSPGGGMYARVKLTKQDRVTS